MMPPVLLAMLALGCLTAIAAGASAQDKTLSEGHPVNLGDAFFVGPGDGTVLGTASAVVPRQSRSLGVMALDLQYGLARGLQLDLGTLLSTRPDQTRDPASRDLTVSARMNVADEEGLRPFLAGLLGATLPTGQGSRGVDLELKGYATKSLYPGPLSMFVHLNASAEFRATGRGTDERLVRYHVAFGPSVTVPSQATTTLVSDVFVDQSVKRDQPDTVGLEFGFRHRLAANVAIHGAVGRELAGPADRAAFFARLGFSVDFEGPALERLKP